MRISGLRLVCAASIALSTLAVDVATAQTTTTRQGKWRITMTDLAAQVTVPGLSFESAVSINELGEIVGMGMENGLRTRPIWKNGQIVGRLEGANGRPYVWNSTREAVGIDIINTKIACHVHWLPNGTSGPLPPLPGADTCTAGAYDVNEDGEMAGAGSQFPLSHRPLTWRDGVIYRDLGMPPGARQAVGTGINDSGEVVGYMTDAATGRVDAFLHSNGQYSVLPPLPGPFGTYAIDINNNGDILGTSNGGVPVVWKRGATAPTILPLPEGRYLDELWRINDRGDVIGSVSAIPPAFTSAALWRNGEFVDLGPGPGNLEAYAYGIDNAGTIVGTAVVTEPSYGWHAVTWTVTSGKTDGGGKPGRPR